jgi:hypothetical protein
VLLVSRHRVLFHGSYCLKAGDRSDLPLLLVMTVFAPFTLCYRRTSSVWRWWRHSRGPPNHLICPQRVCRGAGGGSISLGIWGRMYKMLGLYSGSGLSLHDIPDFPDTASSAGVDSVPVAWVSMFALTKFLFATSTDVADCAAVFMRTSLNPSSWLAYPTGMWEIITSSDLRRPQSDTLPG